MTLDEAFEILEREGITTHKDSVRRWLRSGKLKGELISRREGYRIKPEDLANFMKTKLSAREFTEAAARMQDDSQFMRLEWDFELMDALKAAQTLRAYARLKDNPELEEIADRAHTTVMSDQYDNWFDQIRKTGNIAADREDE